MANFHLSSRKKRGPQPSNLSVRLFLLDPDKTITKVTRETCSKGGTEQLMQKGCGPPQPEHCVSDDKVEFSLGLTNEQFKQKLVEIYPKLENACFVFMKADKNNKLEKLNHGMCCFRCYTPENVYHSERGQGRLYIQKIAESEISQCTHQVSLVKRLCVLPGHSQQRFVPIQPKLLPAVCTITGIESRPLLVMTPGPGAMPLDLSSTPTVLSSGNIVPQRQSSAIVPQTETTPPVCSTVNISTQSLLSSAVIFQNTSSQPVNVIPQNQLPTSTITSQAESNQSLNSSINMVPQDWLQTPPAIVTQTTLSQPVQSSGNMVTQNRLPAPTAIVSQAASRPAAQSYVNMIPQNLLPTLTIASQTESNPLLCSSVNMVTRNQLQPPSDMFSQTVSRPAAQIPVNMVLPNVLLTSTSFVPRNTSTSLFDNSVNMVTQNQLPAPVTAVSWTAPRPAAQNFVNMLPQSQVPSSVSTTAYTPPVLSAATQLPISTSFASGNAAMSPFQDPLNMMTQNQLHASAGSMARQRQFSRSIGVPGTNFEQLAFHTPVSRREPPMAGTDGNVDTSMLLASVSGFQMTNVVSGLHDPSTASNSRMTSLSNPPDFPASSYRWMQSPGLVTLVDAIDTVQRGDWIPTDANISNDQGNLDLQGPVESLMDIDSFLENVKSTGKLEISSSILDNRDLMEKLNASTINIHTVEIESTCKLHQALGIFSLPSCLTILHINDNNLNFEDIFALIRSLTTVNSLHELCVSHTRFKDNTFSIFLNVLTSCSSLRKLCFTDNGLTKQEINFLIPAFESMKDLVNLNLSKSNLTETQANDILRKDGEGKCIVSLDLSQNALQGNKIIIGICHLQSLEELNLSHNHIRFFPLPNLDKQREHLPINTTTISLSSNHMTPEDVGSFCFLIRSNLMKLNLDFNHIGNLIWSLCSQGFKHLKVLSLANTDICGPAVNGLAFLLSFIGELEELNLSSNNLVMGDFQQLQSPLSNLTQLKRLNLSNNPDGISVILHEILPSLKYLEELRLSNVHLNGDGLNKICHSLASLKSLKHLDLSMDAIGADGTRALANILKEFPLLEGLDMSKSCIKEDEISVLCKGLVPLNRLKYLNLSGNRLAIEVIRDPVFLPPMLEELIFSKVIHGGKLFSNISLLQHLRKLHLSEINLRPCDVEALTAMLSSFPLLEELVLAKTVCTDCEKIFSAIKSLENIKKIDLTGIKIPDGNAIAEMLPSLLSLQELVLTNMNVTNKRDGIIFSKIKLLKNLRKLDFDGIKIWDEIAFFDMLSSLSFLEDIVLPRINLKDADDVTGFFRALKSLRYLKNFYVHNVNSKTSVVDDFAKVLPSLLQLEKLVLEGIKFGNQENVKQLFTPVEKLTYLKELELKCFTITQAGADSLAEVLPSLQLLEKLVLENVNYDDDIDDESGKQLFTAVGKLTYLKELELRCVKITQACSDSLAEVLPSLQLLEKLVLKNVRRTDDESIKQVFAAVGKLTYLKELELNWCKITQAGADSLAEVLPSLQLLEKLVLKNVNYVDDNEGEKQLFAAVGKLTYLKELELGCFTITQAGEDSLAEVLPSLQLMEKLVLEYEIYDDDDDDESGKQLFTAVGKLMYLKELEFKCYVITQACSDSLAEVLPSLQLLEKLVLKDVIYSADIDDGSKKQLFAAVGKLTYLKELEFEWWTISQAGANSLAEVLPSLQSLEKLVLKDVNYDVDIDDESEKQLFTAVGKLMYLKELQLKWNNITQAGVDSLAEVLPSLQLLEKLVLEDVNHDDDDDDDDDDDESGKQLFAAVGKLMYLKELQLKWNKITQASVDSLAEVLSSLQLLEKLELRTFNFTNINDQQLYTAIGSLSCLKELNLSFTKITDAGAENLIDVLPSLRHLTCITLPSVYGTLGSRLEAAASQVPGLKVK